MPTPTSAAIIAASRDTDLLDRLVALGATIGLSQGEVEAARVQLASAPVDGDGNTVASVHEYAAETYNPTPRPGADPDKIRDEQLLHALGTIKRTA